MVIHPCSRLHYFSTGRLSIAHRGQRPNTHPPLFFFFRSCGQISSFSPVVCSSRSTEISAWILAQSVVFSQPGELACGTIATRSPTLIHPKFVLSYKELISNCMTVHVAALLTVWRSTFPFSCSRRPLWPKTTSSGSHLTHCFDVP